MNVVLEIIIDLPVDADDSLIDILYDLQLGSVYGASTIYSIELDSQPSLFKKPWSIISTVNGINIRTVTKYRTKHLLQSLLRDWLLFAVSKNIWLLLVVYLRLSNINKKLAGNNTSFRELYGAWAGLRVIKVKSRKIKDA